MRSIFGRATLAGFALVALASPAIALWLPNGTPIQSWRDLRDYSPIAVSDGASGALIAWLTMINDSSGAIHIHRVNATGSAGDWFPPTVTILNVSLVTHDPTIPWKLDHAIAPDGSGGLYVAWRDRRNDRDGDLFLQHYDAQGWAKPGWPERGVTIHVGTGYEYDPALAADDYGGVFVAWSDSRVNFYHAFVQRFGADGQVTPGWPADGVRVDTDASNHQTKAVVASDGAGGAYVGWWDTRFNGASYLQHVGPYGQIAPGWPTDGLALAPTHTQDLRLLSSGLGDVYAVWTDVPLDGPPWQVHVQRVSPGGMLAAGWPVGGRALGGSVASSFDVGAVADAGGIVVAWTDLRDFAADHAYHVYAQRVLENGTLAAGWGVAGLRPGIGAHQEEFPRLATDGAGGALVTWAERDGASPRTLRARRITAAATFGPPDRAEGVTVCAIGDPASPEVVSDGRGGLIEVWYDARSGSGDIYALGVPGFQFDVPGSTAAPSGALALSPPRPNPSAASSTWSLVIPAEGSLQAEVRDLTGRKLRTLLDAPRVAPGYAEIHWDGRDDLGARARPGVYFVRVRTAAGERTVRVVRL